MNSKQINELYILHLQRASVWHKFDCDYFIEFLPVLNKHYKIEITTEAETLRTLLITTERPNTSIYWPTLVLLTIIFFIFAIFIFLPLLFFRRIKKSSDEIYLNEQHKQN